MSIELAYWCERRYRRLYRRLRVLPVPGGDDALWLDDGRVRAVVGAHSPEAGRAGVDLAVVQMEGEPRWFLRGHAKWDALAEDTALELLEAADVDPDEDLRRLVVEAIYHDHARQLTGNLLAGFVKRLDQQFPRAELYVFELLQNAVDEGAQRVSFEVREGSLVFQHDGEPFNASDVLGLSAVGASGKSGRTVGFMGLGFKAVYSRFDRVVLRGGGWCVRFERPDGARDGGWKFLPQWHPEAPEPEAGFTCRFDFGRPHAGANAIVEDLARLDDVVSVVLARRALGEEGAAWSLNWNGRRVTVERELDGPGGVARLCLRDGVRQRRWFFLGTTWEPTAPAIEAWRSFRDDPDGDPGTQELALFAELDGSDDLLEGQPEGLLYAVLPTAQSLPLGFHLQANWLLQADRQGAMSARDNAWNAEIVSHLPDLVVRLLQWIAHGDGPPTVIEAYRRLPRLEDVDGKRCLHLLDVAIDFSSVVEALQTDALVPTLAMGADRAAEPMVESEASAQADRALARHWFTSGEEGQVGFATASECRLLPDALQRGLSARFLQEWFGGRKPFAFPLDERAGDFFRSTGVLREPSSGEWSEATEHYTTVLASLPSERVRAWAAIHVLACVLRSRERKGGVPESVGVVPDGGWRPRALRALEVPPRDFLRLDEQARSLLANDLGAAPALPLLQVLIAPPSPDKVDAQDARTVADAFWPGGAQERRLRELTERFFKRLASDAKGWDEAPQPLASAVVVVTAAIRRLSVGHEAMTHVLAREGDRLRLLPKAQVWVGAAYGFQQVEGAAGGHLPLVALEYGDDADWRPFFTAACRTRLEPRWAIHTQGDIADSALLNQYFSSPPHRKRRYHEPHRLPGECGTLSSNEVVVLMAGLDQWETVIAQADFDLQRARSFASFLAQGRFQPTYHWGLALKPTALYGLWSAGKNDLASQPGDRLIPSWLATLRATAWVPTVEQEVLRPCDVLLRPDGRRPDGPVADLDEATRAGLDVIAADLGFGTNVPRASVVTALVRAARRPESDDATLRTLWLDVLGEAELDVAELVAQVWDLDVVPVVVPRKDGKRRVSPRRLIVSRAQHFGTYLAPLAETTLADLETRLVPLLTIPREPTGAQAADYLEWVWKVKPTEVDDVVVGAWRLAAQAPDVHPRLQALRERGAMALFARPPGARRGEWLSLPSTPPRTPVWNDDAAKAACLRPGDGLWVEAWLSRALEPGDAATVVRLLDIGRLSDPVFELRIERVGNTPMPAETARLGAIARAVSRNREGILAEPTALSLRRAEHVVRTFSIGSGAARCEALEAHWDGRDQLYVVGARAAAWAPDLRPLVQQALGLGPNAAALRLLDLIPLLDDAELFERKFCQLWRELDLPGDPEATLENLTDAEDEAPAPLDQEDESRDLEDVESGDDVDDTTEGDEGDPHSQEEDDEPEDGAEDEDPDDEGEEQDDEVDEVDEDDTGEEGNASADRGAGDDGQDDERSGDRKARDRRRRRRRKRSSHRSPRTSQAPNRFLMEPGSDDGSDEKAERERTLPKDDAAARQAVMAYERKWEREPEEADRYQRGYDVLSLDADLEVRYIEVKGLEGRWTGDATVAMTGAQLDAARSEPGDWWLYVVENVGSPEENVIPLHNPAKGARRFYLYARHWRAQAKRS